MNSVGDQIRNESARSLAEPEIDGPASQRDQNKAPKIGAYGKEEPDPTLEGKDLPDTPTKPGIENKVLKNGKSASTVVAEFVDDYLHIAPIKANTTSRPVSEFTNEVTGTKNLGIEGGESDLTERDAMQTTGKMAKYALGMPLSAMALAATHEHGAARTRDANQRDTDSKEKPEPGFVDKLKNAYAEGMNSAQAELAAPKQEAPQQPSQSAPSRRSVWEIE